MIKHDMEQGTSEWHHWRKGKVTGTTLKSIMGTPAKRQDTIYEIIAERLTVGTEGEENYENPMDRGVRLEPDAIAMFELETDKKVDRIGGATDDDNPMIANSPDGLIGETEAIEVKCMGGKNHIKMWLTNEIPDDYFWQVVQYFVVNEKLETLYFVGYNPDIAVYPLHIIEIDRQKIDKDIETARTKQIAFLSEVEAILSTLIELPN